MAQFSILERHIAETLRCFPHVKRIIKFYYQRCSYSFNKKKYDYQCTKEIRQIKYGITATFFGYYDKSPVNNTGKYVAFYSVADQTSIIKFSEPADIICYDLESEKHQFIDSTNAYNWQQGSRLQWINSDRFIYNIYENGVYKSKIHDVKQNCSGSTYGIPIYDCFKENYALSLSFERLAEYNHEYGYFCKTGNALKSLVDDGVFYLDLKSGKHELVYSIAEAVNLKQHSSMKGADHLFNHIMISPSGDKFIFIHRWYKNKIRQDRLLMYNFQQYKVSILVDEGMVSHCCWLDNDTVVGYFKNLGSNGYFRIDLQTQRIEPLSQLLYGFPDGHPSFYKKLMIFDTYPDKSRMQKLYLLDLDNNQLKEIGEFLAPFTFYGENRCDLHPKWASDGKSVYIESTHERVRKLYQINLDI